MTASAMSDGKSYGLGANAPRGPVRFGRCRDFSSAERGRRSAICIPRLRGVVASRRDAPRRAVARLSCVLLAYLAYPTNAPAQTGAGTNAPLTVTLSGAVTMALTHYPQIRAALAQQAAAQASVGLARTAYLPRADVLWQTNRATANNVYGLLLPQAIIPSISGPVLAPDNARSAWASGGGALLSWEPFDFGLRRAQVDVARQGLAAAAVGVRVTRLDVAAAAASAFLDLAAGEELAAVAVANVARLRVFADAVHALVTNQLRPGSDAAQADATLAAARTQLFRARATVEVRRVALANLLGTPTTAVEVDASRLLGPPPVDTLPGTLVVAHPVAQQEAALVAQQQARVSALDRSYVPRLSTEAAVSGRGTGTALTGVFPGGTAGLGPTTFNWAAGIQVTFPVFDVFSLGAERRVETATARAEQARYAQTLDDLSAQVLEARAQLQGARLTADNTPAELAAARLAEGEVRARFQAGLATVVDVSAAESALVQAESDDAVARLDVWRALASLSTAQGDLTPFLGLFGTAP